MLIVDPGSWCMCLITETVPDLSLAPNVYTSTTQRFIDSGTQEGMLLNSWIGICDPQSFTHPVVRSFGL